MDHTGTPFEGTMMEALDMEMVEARPDRVVMRLPVGPKVRQPYGVLHGGASVVLAESAASFGTALNIDPKTQWAVGMEINANHLRSVRGGSVTAEATPIHKGRSSMVWDIRIRDDAGRLVCISRCTVAIVPRRDG
ncbi:MAG: hotdog fold thioesterase [Deltaproteobacteria bacterium]|nr:hotdog fold thioesterase [Deltaproteobacteria bacterium]